MWNLEGEWTSSVRRTMRQEDLLKAYLDNANGVKGPPFERVGVDDADYPDGKLVDETVVVLIGDHGWNLGEHTTWTKHSLFDVTLRTPMIIRDPNRKHGRITAVTDFLDVVPALTELAGLPTPPGLDGTSLVPALEDPTVTVKPASFNRRFDGESVGMAWFRYTEWRSQAGDVTASMLYDLSIDPEETRNVAEVSAYEEVVLELSARIKSIRSGRHHCGRVFSTKAVATPSIQRRAGRRHRVSP